ncbi:hypothetical protein BJY52DRAFT_1227715 [Lactarius psammicola]|nr:hypothetical protein BJY52DRAFT_1227715 [Lactarius psammicola]
MNMSHQGRHIAKSSSSSVAYPLLKLSHVPVDTWVFAQYSIERRGDRNIPVRYLTNARWGTINSTTGYWVEIPTRPLRYYPVEFNFEHTCWTEVAWSPCRGRWDVLRPTGPEYRCNILQSKVTHRDQWGPIDGTESDSAPAPSDASEEATTTEDDIGDRPDAEEAQQLQRINEIHINSLAAQAENIVIGSPAAMAMETRTYTEEENRLADALAERRIQNAREEERAPSPLQPEE